MISSAQEQQNESSDEVLMAAFQRGDPEAFDLLYRRYFPRLCSFFGLARTIRDYAQDLTEECFIKIVTHKQQYDPSKGSFRVWLYSIAHRQRISFLRKVSSNSVFKDDCLRFPPAPPQLSDDELLVAMCLKQLPSLQREVLYLKYFAGFTEVEIGEMLGLPVGTVSSRRANALHQLRKVLGVESSSRPYISSVGVEI
jgi:RNA polymerase sigma-70 factor (ECF subfamily)